jgi:hypothetical protein
MPKRKKSLSYRQTVGKDNWITLPPQLCRYGNIELGDELQCIVRKDGLLLLLPPVNKRPKAYDQVLKEAVAYMDGNEELAMLWLHRPQQSLGGKRPIDRIKTAKGVKDVENLIGRLEHGVLV